MFIKLTNASPAHKDQPVVINTEHIISVHRTEVTREDFSKDTITYVYAGTSGTWEIVETLDEIFEMIK